MVLIQSDLAHRRRPDLELLCVKPIECLILEVMMRKQKWLYICVYNPKNQHKNVCCNVLEDILNVCINDFHTVYVIGDLNINTLCPRDSSNLADVMSRYSLSNIVKGPTCYKSISGTGIDVIYTDNANKVLSTFNINTGISDFHHIVGFATKIHMPRPKASHIVYRSYKNLTNRLINAAFHMHHFMYLKYLMISMTFIGSMKSCYLIL